MPERKARGVKRRPSLVLKELPKRHFDEFIDFFMEFLNSDMEHMSRGDFLHLFSDFTERFYGEVYDELFTIDAGPENRYALKLVQLVARGLLLEFQALADVSVQRGTLQTYIPWTNTSLSFWGIHNYDSPITDNRKKYDYQICIQGRRVSVRPKTAPEVQPWIFDGQSMSLKISCIGTDRTRTGVVKDPVDVYPHVPFSNEDIFKRFIQEKAWAAYLIDRESQGERQEVLEEEYFLAATDYSEAEGLEPQAKRVPKGVDEEELLLRQYKAIDEPVIYKGCSDKSILLTLITVLLPVLEKFPIDIIRRCPQCKVYFRITQKKQTDLCRKCQGKASVYKWREENRSEYNMYQKIRVPGVKSQTISQIRSIIEQDKLKS